MSFEPIVQSLLSSCFSTIPYEVVEPYLDLARNEMARYGCDSNEAAVQLFALLFVLRECSSEIFELLLKLCPAMEGQLYL